MTTTSLRCALKSQLFAIVTVGGNCLGLTCESWRKTCKHSHNC